MRKNSSANCVSCGAPKVSVIDSRPDETGAYIRRKRVCRACGHRWTTYEVSAERMAELEGLRKFKESVQALLGSDA